MSNHLCVILLGLLLHSGRAEDLATNQGDIIPPPTNGLPVVAHEPSLAEVRAQQEALLRAIEQVRSEAQAAAQTNATALAEQLSQIEQVLNARRETELEAMQRSNRMVLVFLGAVAGVGFLGMFLIAWFQLRTMKRFGEATLAVPLGLGTPLMVPALGAGSASVPGPPLEPSSMRVLGALDQLERRLHDLEDTIEKTPEPFAPGPPKPDGNPAVAAVPAKGGEAPADSGPPTDAEQAASLAEARGPVAPAQASHAALLLGKSETHLKLGHVEEALRCVDEALELESGNPEALIKRGVVLEKLQRWDEAIRSYDQAIAADGSLTLAYLYKGGIFNRLERYREALECYEMALRTHPRNPPGSSRRAPAKPHAPARQPKESVEPR